MTRLATVYASDEDVCVRATDDYRHLCSGSDTLAYGTDGVFGPSDRWTISSASEDFQANGVAAGNVIILEKSGVFSAQGDCFAVESVAANACTVRRLNRDAGSGKPPGPSSGATAVKFTVASLYSTIENVSYDLNYRFGISLPWTTFRTADDVADLRQLRKLCVERVLAERFLAIAKQTQNDLWYAKYASFSKAADETLRTVEVRFGPQGDVEAPAKAFFSRISR